MNIAAIIAEYNPFHNGHRYHVEQTRLAGATHIVAVMSGNYVQRGEAALLEKHTRASAALAGGVDLVVELPLPYAVASAERFAFGAVRLLEEMGCVDTLSFGSESGSIHLLLRAAELLESDDFSLELQNHIVKGDTFAVARGNAVRSLAGSEIAELLSSPNNTLAISYLQQLIKNKSRIKPFTVKRDSVEHDAKKAVGSLASASMLRSLAVEEMKPFVPIQAYEMYYQEFSQGRCIDANRLDAAALAILRLMKTEDFANLPDCSEGIENRIFTAIRNGSSMQEIAELAKTKRYTMARLRRIILSGVLKVDKELCMQAPPYIRVLGANSRGVEVLSMCKTTAALPILHSLARLSEYSPLCKQFAFTEAQSTDIYTACFKKPLSCGLDYTAPPIYTL